MARQTIKYARTTVEPDQSAQEITALCRRYSNAKRVEMIWGDDGTLTSIRFTMSTPEGEVPVLLRAASETIYRILVKRRSPRATKSLAEVRKQAERIAWRHLKDWTEQTLLAAYLGIHKTATIAFMAHLETRDGITLGENLLGEAQGHSGGLHGLLRLKPGKGGP